MNMVKKITKRLTKQFRLGEKGFTLIEMLIVVAILGVLAAVAVPNVGNFISSGKTQAYATEKHSVEMAVMAMLVESTDGVIVSASGDATSDLDNFTTDGPSGSLTLSGYMTGLDSNNNVKSGCTYTITAAGVVTQNAPN